MGVLNGIRILDFARVLAGPWATQLLADLGAEVIKVERPGRGDDTRAWGPPFLQAPDGTQLPDSAYFCCTNRNKKSVCIDIESPAGRDIARRLAAKSDVVIENFKVGGLAKYGLDYASLKALKPDIIYCSITGFGQDGPRAGEAGYDLLIQGMGGLMSVTGRPDDEPGGGPLKVGVALVDIITGLYASNAILAALRHRDQTGKGQYIDVALLDCLVAALANQSHAYLQNGTVPGRLGNAHPSIVPYDCFPTADGHIMLAVGNDDQFRRFCTLAGLPHLADDPAYTTNKARVANRAHLIPLLQDSLRTRPSAEWISLFAVNAVPCGPINGMDAVFSDPQVIHRQLARKLPHTTAGQVAAVANPLQLSETPVEYPNGPPALGEHTEQVLRNVLGMSSEDIATAHTSKAIDVIG